MRAQLAAVAVAVRRGLVSVHGQVPPPHHSVVLRFLLQVASHEFELEWVSALAAITMKTTSTRTTVEAFSNQRWAFPQPSQTLASGTSTQAGLLQEPK